MTGVRTPDPRTLREDIRRDRANQAAHERARRRAERQDRRRARKTRGEDLTADKPGRFAPAKPLPLSSRGYVGPGGGRWGLMPQLATWISSSVQVCGLYPFTIGSGRVPVGVPLGADLNNWSLVYCDPLSWFLEKMISNPSVMVFGLPGLGKSQLVLRWLIGLADRGHPPLILGDLKGEYSAAIRALGGDVVPITPGLTSINPLDLGSLLAAAEKIGGKVGEELRALALQNAATLIGSLARLVRGKALEDMEETVITLAVHHAHARHAAPELKHLVEIIEGGYDVDELRRSVVADTPAEYTRQVRRLLQTLLSLMHGPMASVFNGPTTVAINLDKPGGVSVDLSGMRRADDKVLAGVMLAVWAHGFAAVDAQWELSQAGHGTFRNPVVVQDELWKPIGLAPGIAKRVDQLSRTNRLEGVAEIRVTHSPRDALALPTNEDRAAAMSFIDNSGMVVCFGLAKNAIRALDETGLGFSEREKAMIAGWRSFRSARGKTRGLITRRRRTPPGAGKAMIKVGAEPGIPVQTVLTADEFALHDTNERWDTPERRRGKVSR